MIDETSANQGFEMREIGRKKATTFTGFCGVHDFEIFKPIEEVDYSKGNKEQEFLFAYRALAKEYHEKKSSLNFINKTIEICSNRNISELEKFFPEVLSNEYRLSKMISSLSPISNGLSAAIKNYEVYKKAMQQNLANSKFHSIRTETFVFPTESRIAVSALINIEFDLEGNPINIIRDPKALVDPCYLTVFPQNGKTYVLLSYLNKRKTKYEFIKKQILNKPIKVQKNILSNMIVTYCENVTISPDLWNSFSIDKQKKNTATFKNTLYEKGNLSAIGYLNIFE